MATSPNYPAAQTFPVPGRTVVSRDLSSGPVETASPADANRALLPSEVANAANTAQEIADNLSQSIDYLQAESQSLQNKFENQQQLLNKLLETRQVNPNYPNIDNLVTTNYIELNALRENIADTQNLIDSYRSQLGFQDVAPAAIRPPLPAGGAISTTGDPLGDGTNDGLGVGSQTSVRGIIYSQNPSTLEQTSVSAEETNPQGGVYTTSSISDFDNTVRYPDPPPIRTEIEESAFRDANAAPQSDSINGLDLPPSVETNPEIQRQLDAAQAASGDTDGRFRSGSITSDTSSGPQNNNARISPAVTSNNVTDWRFRISLAQGALYLYNTSVSPTTDILFPLRATSGVIFPYTPKIDVTYSATYEATDITHTNYKFYNYKNSSVDTINISGDFTAQDTAEANYVLAVIHFFRSVTKMWYGNDTNPRAGTPPPLVYLSGHGSYAFNMHPVVITTFSLSYPTDVDYINAGILAGQGRQLPQYVRPIVGRPSVLDRLRNSKLDRNGYSARSANTVNNINQGSVDTTASTRIPTKLTINLTALPVITRNTISNRFSLQEYATGKLLRGNIEKGNGGGIW